MKIIKRTLILVVGLGLLLYAGMPSGAAQKDFPLSGRGQEQPTCPPGQVLEQPHVKPNGQMAPAFCRPATREGFRWVPAKKGPDGKLRRGYWEPVGPPPPDQEWVPAHYDPDGTWVEGFYREKKTTSPAKGLFGTPGSGEKGGEKRTFPFGR
jgi:hypothetical protein